MASSLFDDNGFLDVRNTEARGINLSYADDRTLRWAAPPVDGALLDALVRYQETFLSHAGSDRRPQTLSQAHAQGLAASGLGSQALEQGIAMLRAFGGRRWTAHKLQDKLQQLEARPGPHLDDALRTRLQEELVKQERETEALDRRYGEGVVALLRTRETLLLDLHSRMTSLLSQG